MIEYLDLLGIPFEFGGRGPETLDCFGLVQICERRATGRELPDYRSPTELAEIAMLMDQNKYRWTCHAKRTDLTPIDYSELKVGRVLEIRVKGMACHIGYIHRPLRFLHTWEETHGVTDERIETWRQRILGVYSYAA